jgi:hypothetical protein
VFVVFQGNIVRQLADAFQHFQQVASCAEHDGEARSFLRQPLAGRRRWRLVAVVASAVGQHQGQGDAAGRGGKQFARADRADCAEQRRLDALKGQQAASRGRPRGRRTAKVDARPVGEHRRRDGGVNVTPRSVMISQNY